MGSSVSAAKKRERVERAGSQSRRNLRHEGNGKRLEPLVERLQRAFTANGVPEEHGEKIEHFVVPKAPPRKTHTLSDVGQNVVFAKMCRHQHGLLEYVMMPPFLIVWCVGLDSAAIREVVFHPLPSQIFSRACFCPGVRL